VLALPLLALLAIAATVRRAESRALLAATGVPSPESPVPVLRVCADPNNLPFSDAGGRGFENQLASLVARELGARVEYTWHAQRRGFVRQTLRAGTCDVIAGIASASELVLATRPYYRSTYVFVSRRDGGPRIASLDDPALQRLRIGVQLVGDDFANTPPAHALARRGLVGQVTGYSVYGDYREEAPPSRIVRAVADGEVDVAIVWGPLAGYYATRQSVALHLAPVTPQVDPPFLPFVFDISMGVRRTDPALRDTLDAILRRRRVEVDRILAHYGVPRVRVPGVPRVARVAPPDEPVP
jgi:mxaJ protein